MIKHIHIIFVSIIVLFYATVAGQAQQFTNNEIKAAYIFKFANFIQWENENKMDKFRIGIFEADTSLLSELVALSKTKNLKSKPIEIVKFTNTSSINNIQIFFVGSDFVAETENILYKVQGKNILLISDNSRLQKAVMINFIYSNDKKRNIEFEINTKNISENKLTISPKLLLLGGTEIDVRKLYNESQDSLKKEREKVQQQKNLLEVQRREMERQNTEIQQQRKVITVHKKNIEEQQQRIEEQKKNLGELSDEVTKQQSVLQKKLEALKLAEDNLKQQEQRIKGQEARIEQHAKTLKAQTDQIDSQQVRIGEQKKTLNVQIATIEKQEYTIYLIGLILILALAFGVFIYRNYKHKQQINKELELKNAAIIEQNIEIQQQKEEIQTQAELLSLTNTELEKLSIVASETDNSVIITDSKGDFVWVNAGFSRLYGMTLSELKHEVGFNLFLTSLNLDIREIKRTLLEEKRSVTYESCHFTRDRSKVWVQTTLTPIFNDAQEIVKFIAIESDISKLKQAEEAIKQQNEEIRAQKETVEEQNIQILAQRDVLHLKNEAIKSSIRYALTIQQAILPAQSEFERYFETFILYMPKDIVSGDFYWLARIIENGVEKVMVAVVDCTGHGVPGAFMSMIGNRLLNELINEKKYYDPATILKMLDAGIVSTLKQRVSENNDGMDICLCKFEKTTNQQTKITFASAKRTIIHSIDDKLVVLKVTRKTIVGIFESYEFVEFKNSELTLKKNDCIYLFTDGLVDQSSNERKRFGTERLLRTLEPNLSKSMDEQRTVLEQALLNHKKDSDQRDDITFIGLRL